MLDDGRYATALAAGWRVLGLFGWQDSEDTPRQLSRVTFAILEVLNRREISGDRKQDPGL